MPRVVVDSRELSQTARIYRTGAASLHEMAGQLKSEPLPAMPAAVDGHVRSQLAAIAAALGFIAESLDHQSGLLAVRAVWAERAAAPGPEGRRFRGWVHNLEVTGRWLGPATAGLARLHDGQLFQRTRSGWVKVADGRERYKVQVRRWIEPYRRRDGRLVRGHYRRVWVTAERDRFTYQQWRQPAGWKPRLGWPASKVPGLRNLGKGADGAAAVTDPFGARLGTIGRGAEYAGRGVMVVGVGLDAYGQWEADKYDPGLDTGERVARAAGSAGMRGAGARAGAEAGAYGGATVGAAVGVWFGGVGAAPGAAIGGVVGGIGGAIAGSWVGGRVSDQVMDIDVPFM